MQPTFQLSVNYVDVDVTVTDAQGNFVRGLSRDDFELLEDGKPQRIDAFSLVELPSERPARFVVGKRTVSGDVRTNRQASTGRVYIMLLDDLDVAASRAGVVRKSAREFIEKHFGANDIAAVVYTSGRRDAAQEFTTDPALILAAIDRFTGQRLMDAESMRVDDYFTAQALSGLDEPTTNSDGSQGQPVINPITRNMSFDPSDLERGQRAVGVLNTVRSLAEYLDSVRGRRKALLLFSEGLDYPMAEVFDSQSGSEILNATREALNAATRANVNFYAIDPRGLIGMTTDFIETTKSGGPSYAGPDITKPVGTPNSGTQALLDEMRMTQDSLRTLADGSGGFAAIDTNSFADAFDRIVQTNSHYYLLGYTAPTHPRDGRFHKIQIRMKKPGLKAVARRGYPSPSGKTPEERRLDEMNKRALDSRKGGSNDTSVQLRAALNSPVQAPGLTLSVHAAPFRSATAAASKEASVAVTVEVDGDQMKFAQQPNGLLADTLELSFFALSDQGKAQRGTKMAMNLAVKPETYQRLQALGVRVNARTPLAPGRYQLRIGARDPLASREGTVFYDIVVPDFSKDPLMMSGLLLSSGAAKEMLTAQRDQDAEKLLTAPATSRRVFAQTDTLALLTEVYNNMPPAQPRQIELSVKLVGSDGRETLVVRDVVANGGQGARPWTAYSYTQQVPLQSVAPGQYLLRVEARDRADEKHTAASESIITVVQK